MSTHGNNVLSFATPVRLLRFGALIVAVGVLALSTTALADGGDRQAQTSVPYFPLRVGNTWVYVLEDGLSDAQWIAGGRPATTHEVRVDARADVGGQEVFSMTNYLFRFIPSDVWFFNDSEGNTAELRTTNRPPEIGPWYSWSDPSLPVELPDFIADCFHGSRGHFLPVHTLSVPAGTFEEVWTVEYDTHPCFDSAVLSESFAPGVGLIQRRILTFLGDEVWSLQSAVVNDVQLREIADKVDAAAAPSTATVATTWGAIKSSYAP